MPLDFAAKPEEDEAASPMPRHPKRAVAATAIKAPDARVRERVEPSLAGVEARGDAALRELSKKFDTWEPKSFRLADAEIDKAIGQVARRDLEDIKFAQS